MYISIHSVFFRAHKESITKIQAKKNRKNSLTYKIRIETNSKAVVASSSVNWYLVNFLDIWPV